MYCQLSKFFHCDAAMNHACCLHALEVNSLSLCVQNVRGGTVKLAHITAPQSDFGGPDGKGDALHAMELALSFEKLNFQKLKELHSVADKNDDAQMADFVEDMLEEQVCRS